MCRDRGHKVADCALDGLCAIGIGQGDLAAAADDVAQLVGLRGIADIAAHAALHGTRPTRVHQHHSALRIAAAQLRHVCRRGGGGDSGDSRTSGAADVLRAGGVQQNGPASCAHYLRRRGCTGRTRAVVVVVREVPTSEVACCFFPRASTCGQQVCNAPDRTCCWPLHHACFKLADRAGWILGNFAWTTASAAGRGRTGMERSRIASAIVSRASRDEPQDVFVLSALCVCVPPTRP